MIRITEEMRLHATIEAKRRDSFIRHHFGVAHLSNFQRDEIGFLGEFACCEYLGLDWKANIRKDYFEIDDFDIIYNGKKVDVKTETVPKKYAQMVRTLAIDDDGIYGRRLINIGQWNLLKKYDLVIFGLFERDSYDLWHPIGFAESKSLQTRYAPTFNRPYGGKYPFAAAPIRTSDLMALEQLK